MPSRVIHFASTIAIVLVGCAAPVPSPIPPSTPPAAPAGKILIPACPADMDCGLEFAVGETIYGLTCEGVDPNSVVDEVLATGEGAFTEARMIAGIPSELWLAVRGNALCEPLEHEWYLAQAEVEPAELEEWGEAVGDIIVP